MITDPTYTYAEIYSNIVEKKLVTDGKDLTVDLIRKKTYPTFTMRSIYGTLNGACDCDGLGVYDDLFSGIDEALSEDRQNTVWGKFDNNFMPRIKPGKAKLLGIGTRWAKKDVQGRRLDLLQNDPEYKGIRHREVIIPALNENGESNFDYPYHWDIQLLITKDVWHLLKTMTIWHHGLHSINRSLLKERVRCSMSIL